LFDLFFPNSWGILVKTSAFFTPVVSLTPDWPPLFPCARSIFSSFRAIGAGMYQFSLTQVAFAFLLSPTWPRPPWGPPPQRSTVFHSRNPPPGVPFFFFGWGGPLISSYGCRFLLGVSFSLLSTWVFLVILSFWLYGLRKSRVHRTFHPPPTSGFVCRSLNPSLPVFCTKNPFPSIAVLGKFR